MEIHLYIFNSADDIINFNTLQYFKLENLEKIDKKAGRTDPVTGVGDKYGFSFTRLCGKMNPP